MVRTQQGDLSHGSQTSVLWGPSQWHDDHSLWMGSWDNTWNSGSQAELVNLYAPGLHLRPVKPECLGDAVQHLGSLTVACGIFSCSIGTLSWGMWDLVPWPGTKPRTPVLWVQSLSHWSPEKSPSVIIFINLLWKSPPQLIANTCESWSFSSWKP